MNRAKSYLRLTNKLLMNTTPKNPFFLGVFFYEYRQLIFYPKLTKNIILHII